MKTYLLFIAILFTYIPCFSEQIHLPQDFKVAQEVTKSVSLKKKVFVKNIIVRCEGIGQDSVIEVMVNGDVKGTLYAPGVDPSYVVTITDEISSIEFRHRKGGAMKVLDILVTVIEKTEIPPVYDLSRSEGVVGLAQAVIHISNVLEYYTTHPDDIIYLVPMKKKAGKVFVMSTAHGELSSKTRKALIELAWHIDFSALYLDELLATPALFDYAIEVLTVRESIRDLID